MTADHGSEKGICYYVTGSTSNGSLTILGEKKYEVMLNGVDITNPDSAALNLLSKKRAYVMLAEGTTNKLTDGTSSKNDHKGALYCKGKLLFNGKGTLEVYGNYNNGIHSADYIIFNTGNNIYAKSTANHGIKANDGVFNRRRLPRASTASRTSPSTADAPPSSLPATASGTPKTWRPRAQPV